MSSNNRLGNSDKPWCLEQLENIWLKGQAASKKMNYRAKNQKKKKAQSTRQLENKKISIYYCGMIFRIYILKEKKTKTKTNPR